jgi:uncharacterized surface protein with fasciclin (FAS1) repeats
MHLHTLLLLLLALPLMSLVSAQGELAAFLQTQPDLSTLLDLITLTNLNDTLSTASNITIVAPTNAAFEAVAQMQIPEGIAVANRDAINVGALLRNHESKDFILRKLLAKCRHLLKHW